MSSSSLVFNLDTRSSKIYNDPTNIKKTLSAKEYVSKILNSIIDNYNYTFIREICDLTDNIIVESNHNQSIINIRFIFYCDNEIIIGIKPHLSLRCCKKVCFKSIKDKIKYEKAQRIFLQSNKLI